MDDAKKYNINFKDLSGLEVRFLRESLIDKHKIILRNNPIPFEGVEIQLKAIERLIEITEPIFFKYMRDQENENDEYKTYLHLKEKFEQTGNK